MHTTIDQLLSSDSATVRAGLAEMNRDLNAMAGGLWRVHPESHLELLAYNATQAIAADVQQDFQHATRRVDWQLNKLGIVAACWEKRIILALADPERETLTGSADWLVKFGAKYSLSCPILTDEQPRLVLALAFSEDADEPVSMLSKLQPWQEALAERI